MIEQFKIRASAIHSIMANPKGSELISVGAKTYCDKWIKEQLTGKRAVITTKYTAKGNLTEFDSIDFIAEMLGLGMLIKNRERFSNEFITGEPDIIVRPLGFGIDAKNSWNIDTFPMTESSIPNNDYEWQALGYMDITGLDLWKIAYVLSDAPIHLIESEARKYCWTNGIDYETANNILGFDLYEMYEKNMTYGDIDKNLRIKCFDVHRDNDKIGRIHYTVECCRTYIAMKLSSGDVPLPKNFVLPDFLARYL